MICSGDENSLWEQIITKFFHDAAKSAPYTEHFKSNPNISSALNFKLESDGSMEYKQMFKNDFILGPSNERQARLRRLKEVCLVYAVLNEIAYFATTWNQSR